MEKVAKRRDVGDGGFPRLASGTAKARVHKPPERGRTMRDRLVTHACTIMAMLPADVLAVVIEKLWPHVDLGYERDCDASDRAGLVAECTYHLQRLTPHELCHLLPVLIEYGRVGPESLIYQGFGPFEGKGGSADG